MIIKSRPAGQAVRRTTTVAITAGLIVVGAAGMASAKEAASGGAAGGGARRLPVTMPVTSLTAKGDPRVGGDGFGFDRCVVRGEAVQQWSVGHC